jgi:hypothetical protein
LGPESKECQNFAGQPKQEVLHFLHIGKTGGNAIKFALKSAMPHEKYHIDLHRHRVRLRDVPVGDKVMFFLREPISRFVSGFYSRKRQGYPRYTNKWTPSEEVAFGLFETPNALATALSSEDPARRLQAEEGMRGIGHVGTSYWDWFESESYLESRMADLFFIGFQESFAGDYEVLKRKLTLPEHAVLPTDEINTHRNPEGIDKRLEPEAIDNLRKWYAREFDCYEFCRSRAAAINAAAG